MFSDVLAMIKTRTEVDILIDDIDVFVDNKYRSRTSNDLRPQSAKVLRNYKGDLMQLKKKLLDLPEVNLILAFEPDEETIETIWAWCRREVDVSAVVKVTVDPSVLGGARISFGGKYGDFTVKKKLDAYEKL